MHGATVDLPDDMLYHDEAEARAGTLPVKDCASAVAPSPDLCLVRSLSVVDSGYVGQDGDEDSNSRCSSYSGEFETTAELCQAVQGPAPLVIEGGVLVENSNHVQVGHSTHYHGPVTLVLSPGKDELSAPGVLPVIREDFAEALMAAKGKPYRPRNPANGSKGHEDFKSLLDGLTEDNALCSRQRILAATAATLVVASIVVCVVILTPDEVIPKVAPIKLPSGLTLVQRDEWLAQPPNEGVDELKTPVDFVILHHSATETCYSFPECLIRTRYVQMFQMESKGWADISYNFLVGGDGYAYVGRGWDKAGAHTLAWNNKSIGICLLGTFIYQRPTNEQMRAVTKLIEYGVQLGKIVPEYKLAGACQFRSTQSPGRVVQDDIKRWDHWWNFTAGDSNCA